MRKKLSSTAQVAKTAKKKRKKKGGVLGRQTLKGHSFLGGIRGGRPGGGVAAWEKHWHNHKPAKALPNDRLWDGPGNGSGRGKKVVEKGFRLTAAL